MMRARELAPAGTPSKASGGETLSPSQVNREGIAAPCLKAGEVSVRAIAVLAAAPMNKP